MYIYLVCLICVGQNFYTELRSKLEPTLRGYKQMSIDADLCYDRMSIDQFSHDVPKAIECISHDQQHETRRYSGITILREIALVASSSYYHLITPVKQFFEHLFVTVTDPKESC
ncbi:unnamed protein product [Rotaria sp. Silwood1]|nr:unnamed protein product [Rotaria sp. Silwood1]CAF1675154.1 unnamed protein product [Rotaria sp. Silwood1]